jgi:4-diphosphocytidyl-2-C-methyl-D-erythritol kinase
MVKTKHVTGDDSAVVKVLAPAKINLTLEILGKRPDGYHDLRSLVVPVSLYDTLTLTRTAVPSIEVSCAIVGLPGENQFILPAPCDNLAVRAARLLRDVTGHSGGAHIEIQKEIPIGGGMGGGSADAAGTLVGLNRLWNTGVPVEQLMELGAQLGSDIPAMVYGKPVCMEGRGEKVRPVTCHWPVGTEWWIVVVNPGFNVPTRDIYRRFRTGLTSPQETFINACFALEGGDVKLAAASLHNTLEAVVFNKYPLLSMIAERLKSAGALGVLLSGSGASVFAMASNHDQALAIESQVKRELGSWLWTKIAQILPDSVMVAHGPLTARV